MSRVYLSHIVEHKRESLKQIDYNIDQLKAFSSIMPKPVSFKKAMQKPGLSIIGEIKKASPSKGIIREDFKPLEIAKEYETCVDAISVLTEEKFFLGKDEYLKEVSREVSIPTLCKDFILSEKQVYLAKLLGASCILLIVAILEEHELKSLYDLAKSLDLDVLVEVHNKQELDIAIKNNCDIIGINNRNLNTFKTDVQTTLDLSKCIPSTKVIISESGIMSVDDIEKLKGTGIDGILVGESFMRTADIEKYAKEIKDEYKS